MENFIYPYQESDRAQITDASGTSIVVGRHLFQKIALEAARTLKPEELALCLRLVADRIWEQAGSSGPHEKILACKIHTLAAQLAEIGVELAAPYQR
jgi:hypothetical protein